MHTTPTSAKDASSDPWLQHDPWAKPAQSTKLIPKDQMAVLEAQVAQKVTATMQAQADATMSGGHEDRFQQLEAQVKSLTSNLSQLHTNVSQFHTQQQQQNSQMANDFSHLKQHVDTQAANLEGMIEGKLNDQMSRFEALLCKRSKTNEWQAAPWPRGSQPSWPTDQLLTSWTHHRGSKSYRFADKIMHPDTTSRGQSIYLVFFRDTAHSSWYPQIQPRASRQPKWF